MVAQPHPLIDRGLYNTYMYVWLYVYAHYRSLVFIDTWFFSSVLLCNPAGKLQAGRALLPSPVTWATKKNGEEILRKLGYGEKLTSYIYIPNTMAYIYIYAYINMYMEKMGY